VEKSEREKEIYQLRNVELKAAYEEITARNKEITESIDYASRIQAALLPQNENLEKFFLEHFILFLPREVVSGDFYWSADVGQKMVFAAVDCTGHGVPGAFMSMLGISFLNEIVVERRETEPGKILDIMRSEVIRALKQKGAEDEQKDGMDMALCTYEARSGLLQYAGAFNPLWLIRDGKLEEYSADRMPICFYHEMTTAFKTQSVQLREGDQLYLFSDGYADQVGGADRKKLKKKNLRNLLLEISSESMEVQGQLLHDRFMQWKGDNEQYDDVVILGIRIPKVPKSR
jgi:serine phosphatase RsbU (regulator of sigma subunit)